jgi:hypothetical protein
LVEGAVETTRVLRTNKRCTKVLSRAGASKAGEEKRNALESITLNNKGKREQRVGSYLGDTYIE